ncbi:DNRLRE domain-containing protein [Streptomyces sp. BI20]|uniref:DNRLRE domain-containing protein n=1 Tax=Streptomyces sp. BI20 TaxID=3403460 RepID=UPI003C76583D
MNLTRLVGPFVRTRTRLTATLGLLVAALVAALMPWWQPDSPPTAADTGAGEARQAATGPRDAKAAATEARRTGKDVPVETETDATTLTWAQPDGRLRTKISALPQRAKTVEGDWAPIDTTLANDAKAKDANGLTVRPANAALPVRFSGGSTKVAASKGSSASPQTAGSVPLPGSRPVTLRTVEDTPKTTPATPAAEAPTVLAELELGAHKVAFTWPGELPAPVLQGPRALYRDVLPGVDLLLVARKEGGFGQVLIVKTKEAAAQEELKTLSYGLKSDTAVFRHDGDSQRIAVLDAKSEEEIGSVPTPFAWDSAGQDPENPDAPVRTAAGSTAEVLRLTGLAGMEPGAKQAPLPIDVLGHNTSDATLRLDVAATGLLTDADTKFPVFIDPTMKSGESAWTTAYKRYPNSSYFNGTNYNDGTAEARVGHENDTGGTARAFWRMGFDTKIKGAKLTSATFRVLNNHSWSCTKRDYDFNITNPISSGTTWNKQPTWSTLQERKSFANGYKTGCPDAYVGFNVLDAAQKAANNGWGDITLGMKAISEGDTYTWRKFKADTAELEVVYNRAPATPGDATTNPGGACVKSPATNVVAKANLVLKAKSSDADGNLSKIRFRFWKDGTARPATGTEVTTLSDGTASTTVVSTNLVDKGVYNWDVEAVDSVGVASPVFPGGGVYCRVTVDASGPPAPEVSSDVFKEATPDGATWATVRFGQTGPVKFKAEGAAKFRYSFAGLNIKEVAAVNGEVTIPDLKPTHSGPVALLVNAVDSVGNLSQRTSYTFYLPPRQEADGPGDLGGDGRADMLAIDAKGDLVTFPADEKGEMFSSLAASYTTDGTLNPKGHWFDPATGKTALITHRSDVYPGDGTTDLFARTPDGGFWIYPGDGYGSFNVDKRVRVKVPSDVPNPSEWTQIMAVGDLTGDKRPELFLRTGAAMWVLEGYTGGAFGKATLLNDGYWTDALRELVAIGDIDLDGKADLAWRSPESGTMYLRYGKPGTAAGSTDLTSLATAGGSRDGKDITYGVQWTKATFPLVLSTPDISGDGIPDIWAKANGQVWVYHPGKTDTGPNVQAVLGPEWSGLKALG